MSGTQPQNWNWPWKKASDGNKFYASATLNFCPLLLFAVVINASIIVKIFKWQFKHTTTRKKRENFHLFSTRGQQTRKPHSIVYCLKIFGDFSLITFMGEGDSGMRCKHQKKKGPRKKKREREANATDSIDAKQSPRNIWMDSLFLHPVKISQDLGLLFYHLVSSYEMVFWNVFRLSIFPSLLPLLRGRTSNAKENK